MDTAELWGMCMTRSMSDQQSSDFVSLLNAKPSGWRHQMETFSALLALCARNSPVTGEFPAQRPVTRSFDVFFGLRLNKRLSQQSWSWWFETPSCPLWRHCNVNVAWLHLAFTKMSSIQWLKISSPRHGYIDKCYEIHALVVRRAGLLWSQQDFEWRWSVPLFKCLTVLEFSFILFDLCLLITFFNFIMNYVPIVTFWIFTYHKIWILSIMFCSIWSYWIVYFLACLEVSWRVVS